MVNLTHKDFADEVHLLKEGPPAVIDFYADWCGPCKAIAPVLAELSQEYPDVQFFKVNVDSEQELSSRMQIQSIPALLFVTKKGEQSWLIGAQPKEVFRKKIAELVQG